MALLLKITSDNNQQTGAFVLLWCCTAYVCSWLPTFREKIEAAQDKRAGPSQKLTPTNIPLISFNFPHKALVLPAAAIYRDITHGDGVHALFHVCCSDETARMTPSCPATSPTSEYDVLPTHSAAGVIRERVHILLLVILRISSLSVNCYNVVTLESKSNDTLPRNWLAAMEKYGSRKQYKLCIVCTKTVFILCAAVIYTGWFVRKRNKQRVHYMISTFRGCEI